jgi:hypothetical protein
MFLFTLHRPGRAPLACPTPTPVADSLADSRTVALRTTTTVGGGVR